MGQDRTFCTVVRVNEFTYILLNCYTTLRTVQNNVYSGSLLRYKRNSSLKSIMNIVPFKFSLISVIRLGVNFIQNINILYAKFIIWFIVTQALTLSGDSLYNPSSKFTDGLINRFFSTLLVLFHIYHFYFKYEIIFNNS